MVYGVVKNTLDRKLFSGSLMSLMRNGKRSTGSINVNVIHDDDVERRGKKATESNIVFQAEQ